MSESEVDQAYGFFSIFTNLIDIGLDDILLQLALEESERQEYNKQFTNPATKDELKDLSQVDINNNKICPICMEDMKTQDKIVQLKCDHQYHENCIKEWLKINRICPTCRNDINSS